MVKIDLLLKMIVVSNALVYIFSMIPKEDDVIADYQKWATENAGKDFFKEGPIMLWIKMYLTFTVKDNPIPFMLLFSLVIAIAGAIIQHPEVSKLEITGHEIKL